MRISDIAEAQAIPPRFLEVILAQLKQSGFVDSKRGNKGGYFLALLPKDLTVGQVIRAIQGPIGPIHCVGGRNDGDGRCPLHGNCVFLDMWERARRAVCEVYDSTNFEALVEQDRRQNQRYVPHYCI